MPRNLKTRFKIHSLVMLIAVTALLSFPRPAAAFGTPTFDAAGNAIRSTIAAMNQVMTAYTAVMQGDIEGILGAAQPIPGMEGSLQAYKDFKGGSKEFLSANEELGLLFNGVIQGACGDLTPPIPQIKPNFQFPDFGLPGGDFCEAVDFASGELDIEPLDQGFYGRLANDVDLAKGYTLSAVLEDTQDALAFGDPCQRDAEGFVVGVDFDLGPDFGMIKAGSEIDAPVTCKDIIGTKERVNVVRLKEGSINDRAQELPRVSRSTTEIERLNRKKQFTLVERLTQLDLVYTQAKGFASGAEAELQTLSQGISKVEGHTPAVQMAARAAILNAQIQARQLEVLAAMAGVQFAQGAIEDLPNNIDYQRFVTFKDAEVATPDQVAAILEHRRDTDPYYARRDINEMIGKYLVGLEAPQNLAQSIESE